MNNINPIQSSVSQHTIVVSYYVHTQYGPSVEVCANGCKFKKPITLVYLDTHQFVVSFQMCVQFVALIVVVGTQVHVYTTFLALL
jgi:hypothetical protein